MYVRLKELRQVNIPQYQKTNMVGLALSDIKTYFEIITIKTVKQWEQLNQNIVPSNKWIHIET